MPFPVLGSNSAVAGYEIDNSLRFNDDDSAYLEKTFSAGNRRTYTWSGWVKRSTLSTYQRLFSASAVGDNEHLIFRNTDDLHFFSGDATADVKTNQLFRDVSAWYHIVLVVDTTDGTASNRVKLYLNGSQITSLANSTYPSQNADTGFNEAVAHSIGRSDSSGQYYDGYMSDVYFIDGQALAPTEFGETNDNGVWIPKRFSGSYGTNGFKLEFKNSGSLGTDTSGNTNDFTATNLTATDQTTDTPTNNFCTFNPIFTGQRGTFSEGNTKIVTNVQAIANFGQSVLGTFLLSSGKWYWEIECDDIGSGGNTGIGAAERIDAGIYNNGHNLLGSTGNSHYNSSGFLKISAESNITAGVSSYTSGDIIGVALDLDNSKIYWSKNGSWQASGDPSNNSNGISLTSSYNDNWVPFCSKDDTTNNATFIANFGNPPTTISSGNSDANGYGNMEYAVPTGFYTCCTKNLAEYG